MPQRARLGGGRKLAVLLLPWVFLGVFATLYLNILLPHARAGNIAAACVAVFAAMVFVSFSIAAVTFSRDVLADRYP